MSFANQSWSTILRALSIAGKAALMFVLANELAVDDYGVFGIVVTTIGLVIYLLGFEFYTHTTRYIVGEAGSLEDHLRNHLVFLSLNYLLWLPFVYCIFLLEVVPYDLMVSFYLLLIVEHLSTEVYRLLIALKRPISASISFFIRNALWAYVLILVIFVGLAEIDLSTVLIGWSVAGVLSIVYGCSRLKLRWRRLFSAQVDWTWIKAGVAIGASFLLGTLFMRASGFADRYLIQYFMGNYYVGIYMLYISIAGIAGSFFESGIVMHAFPGILEAKKRNELDLYRARLRSFFRQSLYISVFLVMGAYAAFEVALALEALPADYGSEMACFLVTLLSVVVKNLSYTPHYGLYVHGLDSKILYSSIAGFVVGIALCAYLIPGFGILGAAVAMLAANSIVLIAKSIYYVVYDESRN